MAIFVIDGKIGSGKTYYAVYYILHKYYRYDEILDDYFPRKDIILLSNIDGLKLDHIALDAEVQKHGLEYVFSEQYVNMIRDGKSVPVIFLIDEAQSPDFFHRKYYNEKVFFFFQYSRHYGVDIFLITQDADSLPREIRVLPEYVIHAVSRTHTSGHNFQYKYISNDEVFRTKIVKINKRIFRVYKSFSFDETEKPKPVYLRYLVYIAVPLLISFFVFKYVFLPSFFPKGDRGSTEKTSSDIAKQYGLEVRKQNGKEVYYTPYGHEVKVQDGKIISVSHQDLAKNMPISSQYPATPLSFLAPSPEDIQEHQQPVVQNQNKFTLKKLRDYDFVSDHCSIMNFVLLSSNYETISIENYLCDDYEVSYKNQQLIFFSRVDTEKNSETPIVPLVPPQSPVPVASGGGASERSGTGL